MEEAKSPRDAARLVEKLYEMKTGEAIRIVKLSKRTCPTEWAKIPRRREA